MDKKRLIEKHFYDNSCVKILLSSTTKEISNKGSFPTAGGDTRTMKK